MTNIYIQFSDCGQHIRKWSREPFEGGVRYGERGGAMLSSTRKQFPSIEGCLDQIDAIADTWGNEVGIQQMVDAISSVFCAAVKDQKLNDRFRSQVSALMHTSFVEGFVCATDDPLDTTAKP